MNDHSNIIGVIVPGKGMGNFISYISHFKTINKNTGKKILIFTKSSTSAKLFLNHQKYIHDIIYLNNDDGIFKKIIFYKDLIKLIKKNCLSEIFILHPSKKYALACLLAGVNKIYAPGYKWQFFFINKKYRVYKSFFDKTFDPREENDKLLKNFFSINSLEENTIDLNNKNNKKYIAICIATSGLEKQWGIDNYIKVVQYLADKGYKNFCILSGIDQKDTEEKLINNFDNSEFNFVKTSEKKLDQIMSYLLNVKLYVGNDTGLSHLSVSLKIPSIVIYGDCPAQFYSNYIKPVTIDENVVRSKYSIKTITFDKVKNRINDFL